MEPNRSITLWRPLGTIPRSGTPALQRRNVDNLSQFFNRQARYRSLQSVGAISKLIDLFWYYKSFIPNKQNIKYNIRIFVMEFVN